MFRSFVFIFVLAGCVLQESSVKKKSRKGDNTGPPQDSVSPLVGAWKTSCMNGSDDSYLLTFIFNQNGTASLREEFFYGADCLVKDTVWTSDYTYTDHSGIADFIRIKVTMVAQHTDTVDYFNQPGSEWCGIGNWALNETRDVTNLDCDAFPTQSSTISANYIVNENVLEFFNYHLFENEMYYKDL